MYNYNIHIGDTMDDKLKRIVLEVDINLHSEAKQRAARRNISMKSWICRAIMAQIKREQQYEEQSKQ